MSPQSALPPLESKAALRATLTAFRNELDEEEYRTRSALITARAATLPELRNARCVHVYWPLTARREVDTRPLIDWLHATNKQIVLPVVLNFGPAGGGPPRLEHRLFVSDDRLRPNPWGVLEPVNEEVIPVADLDAVVVPALGADRGGYRIGHGRGYYDEMLRSMAVPTIALVYAGCLSSRVPREQHDVPVSVIVTESEIIRTGEGCNPVRSDA
jgi:5-formyltetrahydrofolate cyclo-ligase